ncbi:MAG: glycosyltransferase family 9 protein [bacterium]
MKRILVLNQNFIGDVVFTLPAIKALYQGHNGSKIDVLVSGSAKEVLAENPYIDYIYIRPKKIKEKMELIRKIRSKNYDICLSFSSKSIELAIFSFLGGCKKRFGFFNPTTFPFFTSTLKENPDYHSALDYLKLAIAAGGRKVSLIPEIFLSLEEIKRGEKLIEELGIRKNKPVFGILLGGSTPFKRWHPPTLKKLLNILKEKGIILLFGGKELWDFGKACEVENVYNLAGRFSLRESIALLKSCSVFIGQDSGLTHISASLGVPTVATYSATDPKRTAPLGKKVRVIFKPPSCGPCWGKRKCKDLICLRMISAGEIAEEAMSIMEGENG